MEALIPSEILDRLTTFGELLRYLRRRAGLTQTELSIAVGYSDAQISGLEQNVRLSNLASVQARFLPVLRLKSEPAARERLLQHVLQAQQQRADAHFGGDIRAGRPTPSIAVLPFTSIGTFPDHEYLCEGVAEEIINALTQIKKFFVVARGSAFSFRGRELDAREIGRRLNVDTILEGSVQKMGDRLRVTAQLIDAGNGFQFWSQRFDRQMTDVFDIQDEITLAIVKQPPIEAMTKAQAAASKALALDHRLAEAHTTLAYRNTHHDWDWAAAEAQFRRAFELNPNYAVCHHWYSHLLMAVGHADESLIASRRCLELDPLDLVINVHMAWHYLFARQYEQAIEQCWKTSELHPNSFWPAWFFGLAYQQQDQIGRPVEELQTAVKMSGDVTFASAALGHLYGTIGKASEARAIFDELVARSHHSFVPSYDIALVCTGLGWPSGTFLKAYKERSGRMTYIKVDPRLDLLRSDARFIDLLNRVRLI
ncbi:MAG: helix-turn-helix domain-containing protein [Steroidobacteraceae bacterium]